MMLKLKLQYFGHLMQRVDSLKKTLMLGGIGGRRRRGRQRMRWLDGITDSMTWVWVNSGSWWRTGRPGVLRFMGHMTEQLIWSDWRLKYLVLRSHSFLGLWSLKHKTKLVTPVSDYFSLVQFRSVAQPCLTLCDTTDCSRPGLPVHRQLPEFTQTHVHRVGDAVQPPHPLSFPSPPAPNPSQHQSLFQWVNSSHEVAKVLELQL